MKILEYDEVDPLKVLFATELALGFSLTPELAAHIRHTDPRPFPYLGLYAVEDDLVLGQVGVFRLPMISTQGREDVGGVWAVSTHPQFAGRGVASRLLDEAHQRMLAAGLRFSTLGTDRFRTAYQLYQKHGYVETNVWATALSRWETAHQPTRLHACPLGERGFDTVDRVFAEIAPEYLGFAWRYAPFAQMRRLAKPEDVWILQENSRVIGYALARKEQDLLKISSLLIHTSIDIAEAVAAVAAEVKSAYVKVKISRPVERDSLQRAGYQVAHPTWDAFMVKPLVPEVSFEEARRLFGIGTDRFLISWLDTT